MPTRLLYNPNPMRVLDNDGDHSAVLVFHRRLPGYAPTPLVEAPALAARLGIGQVWVKNESSRLRLPAFKMLGASWAASRALAARLGGSLEPWDAVDDLRERVAALRPMTLAAATDGNHGRAVARMARLLGFGARIFVPAGTADARIAAIAGLRWSDITLDPPAITWRKAFDKRRREATVPVPAVLVEEVVRTRARLGAFEDGWLFPKDSDPTARWHPKRFDALLRQAEQKAKVSPLPGGLWHPYRRKWATERKHLPAVDVMAAGGWKNRSVLETCYQQATTEAVLEVMASPVKLRELRERKVSGNS